MKAKRKFLVYFFVLFNTILISNVFASQQVVNYLLLAGNNGYEKRGIRTKVNPVVLNKEEGTINEIGGGLSLQIGSNYFIDLNIPGGVVRNDTKVTLELHNDDTLAKEGLASNYTVAVTTDGIASLNTPVIFSLKYPSGTSFPIPYYINENGYLYSCNITNINFDNRVISFELYLKTDSKVFFTWIFENLPENTSTQNPTLNNNVLNASNNNSSTLTTNFKPSRDGFYIKNIEQRADDIYWLTKGGECLGMSSFANWYFLNKGTGFFNKYNYIPQACSCSDNNCSAQDIIATRAHLSINQPGFWEKFRNSLPDFINFIRIKNQLVNTGQPFVLGLLGDDAHAVVAVSIDNDNKIFIYDPNKPGDNNRYIEYSGIFFTYGSYEVIFPISNGNNFSYKENFENIWRNAEQAFRSSDAFIDILSHSSGSSVTDRNITLSGRVRSGEALVEKISAGVNGLDNSASSPVSSSGYFILKLTLEPGENKVYFKTEAKNYKDDLVPITNNMQCSDFILTAPADNNSIVLVTLTWDKNDTDVDLYVIDPNGDYSSYYHKNTLDGGELDYDDTDGFGPEHWTLESNDIIRWNQEYTIRAHYYSDHGNGGTRARITFTLYEGTGRMSTYTYEHYFSTSNSSNASPSGTGIDWYDLPIKIVLTQQSQSAELMNSLFTENNTQLPIITAPVPSKEYLLQLKGNSVSN